MNLTNENQVERHINLYEKNGEKLVGEIPINEVALKDLLELVTAEEYKDDYLLYDCYLLNKEMLDRLSKLANKAIEYDLNKYQYYLEATAN